MQLANLWPIAAGPFAGSVLGVLVRRLPAGRPVALARSACETCGHVLSPLDLVPVVSFVRQRGRCRHCGAPIAPEHLWIELAATAVATSAVLAGGPGPAVWASCVLGWGLLALAVIDARHYRLPDALTLPLLLAGLAATAWLAPDALTEHAAAAAVGYGGFRAIAIGFRWLRGRDGLGAGDAKLLAALGAWQGLAVLPYTILAAAILGLAFGIARVLLRRATLADRIPFGPYLAAGAWLVQLAVVSGRLG